MLNRPLVVFLSVVGFMVLGVLWFSQSPQFARVVKTVAGRYLPKEFGIDADFSEFSIQFYPPGFSIQKPKVLIKSGSRIPLAVGSTLSAESIVFSFRPLQIFSGNIRIHEVTIVDGNIQLFIDPSVSRHSKKSSHFEFHWDELLNVRAESIGIKNSNITIKNIKDGSRLDLHASHLFLGQGFAKGGLGYDLDFDLDHLQGNFLSKLDVPPILEHVRGNAFLNALGLKIESLSMGGEAWSLTANGNIEGNFLEPKILKTNLSVNANVDLQPFLKSLPLPFMKKTPTGQAAFVGTVQGNLLKPFQAAQVEGSLSVRNLHYDLWQVDEVLADVRWETAPLGGVVTVSHASIHSQERSRIAGVQTGAGGKIEISEMKWNLASDDPIFIPLVLQHVHLHWLGAGALAQVYPLDLAVNGKINILASLPKKQRPWQVQVDLDSWVEHFQLDNQRLKKQKPLNILFKVPRLDLAGSLILNSTGLYPKNFQVVLPKSKLVANGKIDFLHGYALDVLGDVDLSDLGMVAGNLISGKGMLHGMVHGPSSAVLIDLDLDTKETHYLNLALGDFRGRLRWDDDLNQLSFEKVDLKKNSTAYSLDGVIDFGAAESMNLQVKVVQGEMRDFLEVFEHLTHPLTWFPSQLNGAFSGNMHINGAPRLSKLKIMTQLNGSNWEYLGERWKSVSVSGGYLEGKYLIDHFVGLKRIGKMYGSVSLSEDQILDWNFKSENFSLSDLDLMNQVDVPIRGQLIFQSSGHGHFGKISSKSHIGLTHFMVRGASFQNSTIDITSLDGILNADASIQGGEGIFNLNYDFNEKNPSSLHLDLNHFNFSPALMVLNAKSNRDTQLQGRISGSVDLKFNAGSLEQSIGQISLNEYLLAQSETHFSLSQPVSFKFSKGNFQIPEVSLKGQDGVSWLVAEGVAGNLRGKIGGDLDLSIIEFFVPSFSQSKGFMRLAFDLGGTLKAPSLMGSINLKNASTRLDSVDLPFENIEGIAFFKKNVINFKKIEADLGGGRAHLDGTISIFSDQYPELNLKAVLDGPKIKIFPFQFAKLSGNLNVNGRVPPYRIGGNLFISSALSREKILTRKQTGQGLRAAQYAPSQKLQAQGGLSNFSLDIGVDASKGILVENELFRDVELKCKLRLVNTLETPRVVGQLDVLRGKLMFKDHVFQIVSARAVFDHPKTIDPTLDLNANTDVNQTKIQLFASGKQDKLKIDLTSNPALPPAEIISLLSIGLTSNDARKFNSTDLSAMQQGEAASLVLHSLDFNRDLEDKTGFQLKVDESVNTTQGVSAFRGQAGVAAPQITIRKKLGKRIELSAGTTVGVGTNKANQVNLDFLVNKNLSITGVYNNYGTFGALDNQASQNSGGLDLKFQKRFK